MVVRRTDTRDFGPTSGWFEEDGTTTTYEPNARRFRAQTRISSAQVPRSMPASQLAPALAGAPWRDAYPQSSKQEAAVPDSDVLEALGDPFARRRSTTSASLWAAIGFAALFASVLVGRVIVHASQELARARPQAKTVQSPPPRAATAAQAPAPAQEQRNEAVLAPGSIE